MIMTLFNPRLMSFSFAVAAVFTNKSGPVPIPAVQGALL
jgi:hypothetical protein